MKKTSQVTASIAAVFLMASCTTAKLVTLQASDPKAVIQVNGKTVGTGKAQVQATGGEYTVSATHPDYDDFTRIIGPTEKEPNTTLMRTFGTVAGVGGGFLLLGLLFSAIAPPPDRYGPSGMATIGTAFMAVGGANAGVGLIGLLTAANAKSYPSRINLDLASLSHFDAEGYNKKTGMDRWGVDRGGKMSDGSTFHGKILQGKKTGWGSWDVPSGNFTLAATFKDNQPDGIGYYFPLGTTEFARLAWMIHFKAGKWEGVGVEFKDGKPAAIHTWSDGNHKTVVTYPSSSPVISSLPFIYFSLELKDGLALGNGEALTIDAKNQLIGRFESGYLVDGSMSLADGSVYQGRFDQGHLVDGKLTTRDGTVREGRFSGDALIEGKITLADGSWKKGHFQNDKLEGQGVLNTVEGEVIEAVFKNGAAQGQAIVRNSYGVERAEFYDGQRIDQVFKMRQIQKEAERRKTAEDERKRAEENQKQKAEQDRLERQREREEEEANRREQEERMAKIRRDLSTPSPLASVTNRGGPTALDEAGRKSREEASQSYGNGKSSTSKQPASSTTPTSAVSSSSASSTSVPASSGGSNQHKGFEPFPYNFMSGWWDKSDIPQRDIDRVAAKRFAINQPVTFTNDGGDVWTSGWISVPGETAEIKMYFQKVGSKNIDPKTMKIIPGDIVWSPVSLEVRSTGPDREVGAGWAPGYFNAVADQVKKNPPKSGQSFTATVNVTGGSKKPGSKGGGTSQ